MIAVMAVGYARVLLVTNALDRYSTRPGMAEETLLSEVMGGITRHRWVWLSPMYGFTILIVVWMVTRAQSAGASPFIYRFF